MCASRVVDGSFAVVFLVPRITPSKLKGSMTRIAITHAFPRAVSGAVSSVEYPLYPSTIGACDMRLDKKIEKAMGSHA